MPCREFVWLFVSNGFVSVRIELLYDFDLWDGIAYSAPRDAHLHNTIYSLCFNMLLELQLQEVQLGVAKWTMEICGLK